MHKRTEMSLLAFCPHLTQVCLDVLLEIFLEKKEKSVHQDTGSVMKQ